MIIKQSEELIKDNLIVKCLAGSHAYGTSLPTSDIDYRGIFVADPINIRTPFFRINEAKDTTEEDTVIYELSQFMKLALDCNPNVVETLWVDQADIVFETPMYQLLRSYAPTLLSSKIAFTTTGYACAQLKRMKSHKKWIMNPQSKEPPSQLDFISLVHNFTSEKIFKIDLRNYYDNYRLVPYADYTYGVYQLDGYQTFDKNTGNLNTTFEGDIHTVGVPLFLIKFNKREYDIVKDKWSQYWEWKRNRNKTRSELEEQYGYDSKHALHLVRLMRMGEEALTMGQIIVKRPDAAELLEIRAGKWTYDELIKYADDKDRYIREVLYKTTSLPKAPNVKLAAKIMMDVQDMVWNG